MSDEFVYCNGIDPDTGAYRVAPMSRDKFAGILLGEQKPENFGVLQARGRRKGDLGVKEGIDPARLESAGWGVIFTQGADPAVEEALSELLQLRRSQAGEHFVIFKGDADKGGGYRAAESARQFLRRNGVGPAEPADPQQGVPYYLLLVGSPQEIPYGFQTQLDVVYAVGRIHFDDLDGYRHYARNVCDAEKGQLPATDRAAFFGVANPDDYATRSSVEKLVTPLTARVAARDDYPHAWQFDPYIATDAQKPATRSNLDRLLGGELKPGLLFTAGHGIDIPWKAGNEGDTAKVQRLLAHQGGLICQDWDGPKSGPVPRDSYFIGEDLRTDRDLRGMIAFFFACFGGGTPLKDQFFRRFLQDQPGNIAPHPFVAGLPKRMLSLPAGALAVIAHVERTWPFSFSWPGMAEPQLAAFESALSVLLKHQPVGMAMEYFNQRYAALTVPLFELKDKIEAGMQYDQGEWISIWTAQSDARGYIIVGDPAVRLPPPGSNSPHTDENQVDETLPVPVIPPPTTAQKVESAPEAAGEPKSGDEEQESEPPVDDFLPFSPPPPLPPAPAPGVKERTDEAYQIWLTAYRAWGKHLESGYQNNDEVFNRVLDAFMRSHYSTLAMYWVLFAVGIAFFIVAAVLALQQGQAVAGAVFGGLSVVAFLTYFVTRPTQSVEENLQFITLLGIIYNSYWTHLAWQFEAENATDAVEKATEQAVERINQLIDRHAKAVRDRPGLLGRVAGR